jgi:AraC family transcriptional regulator of adaptative response / DNA-3-methyladenine glycosylase II
MKQDDIFYRAMLTRDHRFDGKFFVGVKTTRIYCRPICPAKPKRENVEFFSNYLGAEKAGYRPCMRCRPESAPGSPVWIGKSAIVRRAIKIINTKETLQFDEEKFAQMFGVTARHLRRVFIEEIGKTPKQLAFENRLNLARKLITETTLDITSIAFASGFGSIRRFNDAFKKRFHKSPSELRRNKILHDTSLKLALPYRPPYDFEGLMGFYKNHRVGELEIFDEGKMIRIIESNGNVGQVTISNDPDNSSLIVEIDFPDTTYIQTILSRVRDMFDLDSDPVIIANALEIDPGMKKLLQKNQGIRLPSGWDRFETAVASILGQFVSVEMGRRLVCDLIELAGKQIGHVKLFPSAEEVAAADLTSLKTTNARKETLRKLALALITGELSLEPTQDVDEFKKALESIKGIGPWTSNYMALKVLRHTDAFPATDLIIARALEKHPFEAIEKMSPWRGYVTTLLWKEYAQVMQKKR